MLTNRRANLTTESAERHTLSQSADSPTSRPGAEIKLRSLAPEYKKEQHVTYVHHLETVVQDPRNKNIALTGRYGSGKSSILDEFLEKQKKQQKKTLRISINTLGPDDDEDLTNRIQKELVKQLVYRAEPGEIRHSRFARHKELTWWRTLIEAVVVGIVVVGLPWLFGIRPDADAFGTSHIVLPAIALMVLVVGAAWAVRWVIGNRLISQFSTGGTSISFDKQPESYFDEYLDEIVAFFDTTAPDLVVFEDLDRFDDPRIFDSLRELNTLINASARWKDRKMPLRFVYAIKDSLFEKLGEDPQDTDRKVKEPWPQVDVKDSGSGPGAESNLKKQLDRAEAAVERANRTKFFEVVIPVVPFLSHSNARDLLSSVLEEMELPEGTEISRGLLDLVARHTTDMRLLINICNEFVVYAQKLLWIEDGDRAPGLTADDLFALIVYKNFHLADFEKLPQRGSALDVLERRRRQLVDDSIAKLREDKQDLLDKGRLQKEQEETARTLGDRLLTSASTMSQRIRQLSVGKQLYSPQDVGKPAFWKDASEVGSVHLQLIHNSSNHSSQVSINRDQLNTLFPRAMNPHQWSQPNDEIDITRAEIDDKVSLLRGADFAALAKLPTVDGVEGSFAEEVNNHLSSQLARDLVFRGYLTRYYAEYATVFYGDFIGVDVANFFRNHVWPDEKGIQFPFTTPNAVQNVLEQAPEGYTSSRGALNIQVVDHLLKNEQAEEVVAFLVADSGKDALPFLNAFLNDPSSRKADLVGLLAAHPWSGLFDHLTLPHAVTDEATKIELIDAALLNASAASNYELSDGARELIADHHAALTAFTEDSGGKQLDVVQGFIHRSGLTVPSLRLLSDRLRFLVVEDGVYTLTADNLRTALEIGDNEPISLDKIRKDEAVWQRCREDIDTYLDAAGQDDQTKYAVLTPETLSEVVSEQYETWSDSEMTRVLASSAPDAALDDITSVPDDAWPSLVRADRVVPSAKNVFECTGPGNVDAGLAHFLEAVEQLQDIDDLDPADRNELALRMLNSSMEPLKAVNLTEQLDLKQQVLVSDLKPGDDDLLALLLESKLVPDDEITFAHFKAGAGWPAVSTAFSVSERVEEFLSPGLVSDVVADLLRDPRTPNTIKAKVVNNLSEYVPDGESDALREAGKYARKMEIVLAIKQVERIAASGSAIDEVLWQLDADQDLSADDLMRILEKLGGDYLGFGKGPDHEFDVPSSREMGRILIRLAKDKRVETGRTVCGRQTVHITA